MPTITFTVDGPAGKGGTARFEPRAMFEADGKLVTSWASPRLVKYTNNTAVSVVLPEGPWKVGGLSGGNPLPIDVGSTNADLKDLIVFNLPPSAPATTLSQAVAAWMDSNVNTEVTEPLVEGILANPESGARAVLNETYAPVDYALKQLAANPDQLAVGAITRSSSGAATGFSVVWPDGATGAFTGTESATFPGAIDAYAITHIIGGTTTTYTQPALTRDTSGAVTARPAIVVS